jgi:hypothetical protein
MSAVITLAQRAELTKLARMLGEPPQALDWLATLDAKAIRELRERTMAVLFDSDRKRFLGLARASGLLPVALLVKLVENVLSPFLCARVAGLMPAERAIAIASRLKTPFLVAATIEIDPRSAADLVAGMPVVRIVEVAVALAKQGEFVTMGRFLDHITEEAMRAVLKAIDDDEALLSIAFFAEDFERLSEIVELLPEARLKRIVRFAATGTAEIWGEALALMGSVHPDLSRRLAAIAGALDDAALVHMLANTRELACWDQLLPIVLEMDVAQQRRIVQLRELDEPEVLAGIADTAVRMLGAEHVMALLAEAPQAIQDKIITLAKRAGVSFVAGEAKARTPA